MITSGGQGELCRFVDAMTRSARQGRWRRAPASRWHEVPARGDRIALHPEYEERMEWVGESLSV